MIRLLALTLFAFSLTSVQANPLAKYLWKNRLLLWQSDAPEFSAKFQQTWAAEKSENADRDLLILPIDSAALRAHLDVEPGATVILLVGKDGGVKERWTTAVEPKAVFALIDAMPMRQQEMRSSPTNN